MQAWCERIVQSSAFQNTILLVIIVNAILVGIETTPDLSVEQKAGLDIFDHVVQVCFIIEILLRMGAYHPYYWRFFRSGWNIFDFTVVALTFLPQVGTLAAIARLARVLRITRLIEYSKELRLIIDTMFRSIPSMGQVLLMLGLLLYVYGVLGVHFFRDVDERRWFIVIGGFVGINLFVAVVMNNLQEVKEEHEQEKHAHEAPSVILDRVKVLKAQILDLEIAIEQQVKDTLAAVNVQNP